MTYNSNRYSTLDEINKDTVKGLKLAFAVPFMPPSQGASFATSSLQGTPLVEDGIMWATDGWGRVYRVDMTKGDRGYIDWIMDPKTDPEIATGILNNRGVALYGDSVYSMSPDGRLIRTDKATGEVKWEVETQQNPAEYFSMAPLAINGKIIIGPGGGDGPMRGRLEARDPENGDLLWTFWTVPGEGEPGHETWKDDAWKTGGAATWVTGSYDPNRNELVWGIGNPYPDFEPSKRPGDNLYSNSTVAVNADNGKINWHFQYTPNDSWDFDEVGTQQLYAANVNGKDINVVGHFARNGFFYNLDGANGAYINGSKYAANVSWTAGIDPKTGKPIEYDVAKDVQTYLAESRIDTDALFSPDGPEYKYCPYIEGGVNMYPTSYSPNTKLTYGLSIEGCSMKTRPEGDVLTGALTAIDVATGQVVKQLELTSTGRGGTLATAGRLVFGASTNGDVFAVDDTSLERLWNINLGTTIDAPPITFTIDGKQYIAIMVGPGGIPLDFHHYAALGTDSKAKTFLNFQKSSTLYVFTL
jgi:alcohol dehydrogenase (cytochrome c)